MASDQPKSTYLSQICWCTMWSSQSRDWHTTALPIAALLLNWMPTIQRLLGYRAIFSVQQHICYSGVRYMPSPVRPSVCLSVTRVDQSKTVEVRIMQLSSQSSSMTLVSWCLTSPWNSKGKIWSEGAEWHSGRKITQFSANKSPYLRNGARQEQSYY